MVARLLRDQPRLCAERTGIRELANLAALPEPTPNETLAALGRLYFDKSGVTNGELRQSKRYWKSFSEAVNVPTIRDIKQQHINDYNDAILAGGFKSRTVSHHFGKVKTVLNFAAKRGVASMDVARVLAYCKVLVPPKGKTLDPHPIAPAHFQQAYDAGTPWEKAFLMFALNCCMYGAEVGDVQVEDIDWKAKVLVCDRNKTKVARIAVLWDRTVTLLQKMLEQSPRLDKARGPLFLSVQGNRINGNMAGKMWDDLRTTAKLPKSVQLSDLRDGAYTAALELAGDTGNGISMAKLLAGHRIGMSDHYVKRRPQMVKIVCEAVERYYFGKANMMAA